LLKREWIFKTENPPKRIFRLVGALFDAETVCPDDLVGVSKVGDGDQFLMIAACMLYGPKSLSTIGFGEDERTSRLQALEVNL
jgi:hypothetical protein